MPIATIFVIAALILFIVDMFPVASPIKLSAAGWACFMVAVLAGLKIFG